jgi:hypothetical protein
MEYAHLLENQTVETVQGGLTSGRRPVVKIIAEPLSQHNEKHVVPTHLRVESRKKNRYYFMQGSSDNRVNKF